MSRYAFHDPIHPDVEVVLVMDEERDDVPPDKKTLFRFWSGVEHPGCGRLAEVSPHLDAFYCSKCRWNGRISGAWFMDLWRERAASTSSSDRREP